MSESKQAKLEPKVETQPFDVDTAYHEAGHAVIALCLNRLVDQVTIMPKLRYLGKCKFKKAQRRSSDDWIENEILIALAGMVAEARHSGRYDRQSAGMDLRFARKLMELRASPRAMENFEKRMITKTEYMLSDEKTWLAVETIARELLKTGTISGRAATHFFNIAMAES